MKIKVLAVNIFFSALFYASGIFAVDVANSRAKFDFRSAIKYAIEHSPDLNAFRRTHNISQIEHKNKKADFLPNVDIKSTHMVGKNVGVDGGSTASSLGLEITENLYKNGENITNYKKTKLEQDLALLQYQQKRDQLVRAIAIDFLDFSLNKELFVIKAKNFSLLKDQYQKADKQYRQGLKPQKDVVRFKSQMKQAEIDMLRSKNNIELSKQKLLAGMGYAIKDGMRGEAEFILLKLPVVKIPALPVKQPGLVRQYQYRAISLQKRINSLDIDLARRKYWPEVNVKAGATYGNDLKSSGIVSSFGRKKELDWHAGLELSYKLLDWGKEGRNIDKARQNNLRIIDNLNQQLLSVRQDIENVMLGLGLRKKSYSISKELEQSELKNYSTLDKSYRTGDASYLDLTEAIKDLSLAKAQHAVDRYALEKDLYAYYYYIGTIYDKIFK